MVYSQKSLPELSELILGAVRTQGHPVLPVIIIISILKFAHNADIIFFLLEGGDKQGRRTVNLQRRKIKIPRDIQVNLQHIKKRTDLRVIPTNLRRI